MKLFFTLSSVIIIIGLLNACGDSTHTTEQSSPSPIIMDTTYHHFYIGTYTRKEGHVNGVAEGVYCYKMNYETGKISHVSTLTGLINPSFVVLHPNKKWLYAVQEHGGAGNFSTGTVSSILVDTATHQMTLQNTVSAQGAAPCHLSISADGNYVLVANYVGGNIAALPIQADGTLGEATDVVKHTGKNPHAHYINTGRDGKIYVADLGISQTLVYDLKDGKFRLQHSFQSADGAGTRHLAYYTSYLDPEKTFIYALNELNGTIDVLKIAEKLQLIQTVSTTKNSGASEVSSAAIKISLDGRFLYASNRADYNNLAIYRIEPTNGKLSRMEMQSTFGDTPRDFAIDPENRFLLVANQDSGDIVTFEIQEDGTLTKIQQATVASPVCIVFE